MKTYEICVRANGGYWAVEITNDVCTATACETITEACYYIACWKNGELA